MLIHEESGGVALVAPQGDRIVPNVDYSCAGGALGGYLVLKNDECLFQTRSVDIQSYGNLTVRVTWLPPLDTGTGDSSVALKRYELQLQVF